MTCIRTCRRRARPHLARVRQGKRETEAVTIPPDVLKSITDELDMVGKGIGGLAFGDPAPLINCKRLLRLLELDRERVDDLYAALLAVLVLGEDGPGDGRTTEERQYLRAVRYSLGLNHPDQSHSEHELFRTDRNQTARRGAYLKTIGRTDSRTAESHERKGIVLLIDALVAYDFAAGSASKHAESDGVLTLDFNFDGTGLRTSIGGRFLAQPPRHDRFPEIVPKRFFYVGDHGPLAGRLEQVFAADGSSMSAPLSNWIEIEGDTFQLDRRYKARYKALDAVYMRLESAAEAVVVDLSFPAGIKPASVWVFMRPIEADGRDGLHGAIILTTASGWPLHHFHHVFDGTPVRCEVGYAWSWD